MAGEDKKTEISPAPKKEVPPENKSLSGAKPSTTEGAQTPAASSSIYSRGEGQKPVTQAYKDNWNAIFATKTTAAKKARKTVAKKKPAATTAKKKKKEKKNKR